jgi:hypothetical protein
MISFFVGALFALLRQGLISRLLLFALRPMGQTFRRIQVAHLVTYGLIVAACSFGLPFSGPASFPVQLGLNLGPALLWWIYDTLVLMRRRAKLRDAHAISRMR